MSHLRAALVDEDLSAMGYAQFIILGASGNPAFIRIVTFGNLTKKLNLS
jgi:hypothetical protein